VGGCVWAFRAVLTPFDRGKGQGMGMEMETGRRLALLFKMLMSFRGGSGGQGGSGGWHSLFRPDVVLPASG